MCLPRLCTLHRLTFIGCVSALLSIVTSQAIVDAFTDRVVTLGGHMVKEKDLLAVGDIDGNGAIDYGWMTPGEGKLGSVRIFMMDANNTVAYTKHLIPGKWGFDQDLLQEGDHYGASLASIGDINGDGIPDIAIGSPGHRVAGVSYGCVYILLLKRDASILKSHKLSPTQPPISSGKFPENARFGTDIKSINDVTGDSLRELLVSCGSNTKTLVVLDSSGQAANSLRFAAGVEPEELQAGTVGRLRISRSSSRPITGQGTFISRAAGLGAPGIRASKLCHFTDSECACTESVSGSLCYDFAGFVDGNPTCSQRQCDASFKCDCDGKAICERTTFQHQVYRAAQKAIGSEKVPCSLETVTSGKVLKLEGQLAEDSSTNVWNSTHCSCAQRSSVISTASKCLDFLGVNPDGRVVCRVRSCATHADHVCDIDGQSLCQRSSTTRSSYVNEGSNGVPNETFCSMQTVTRETSSCLQNC